MKDNQRFKIHDYGPRKGETGCVFENGIHIDSETQEEWAEWVKSVMKTPLCGVCAGDPIVENCICGGTGTEQGELDGLRNECYRNREIIRRIEAQVDRIRYAMHPDIEASELCFLLGMFDPESGNFNEPL